MLLAIELDLVFDFEATLQLRLELQLELMVVTKAALSGVIIVMSNAALWRNFIVF